MLLGCHPSESLRATQLHGAIPRLTPCLLAELALSGELLHGREPIFRGATMPASDAGVGAPTPSWRRGSPRQRWRMHFRHLNLL